MRDEFTLHERIAQQSRQQAWTKGIVGFFYNMYVETAREFLQKNAADLVLDVGCGEGYILNDYHCHYRIVQIDISPTLLKYAAVYNQKLVCGDAMELPFGDETFDLILLVAVLEHVSEPAKVIEEIHRVAKVGARVLVIIPNDISLSLGRLILLKFPLRYPGHLTFFTPKKLREVVSERFRIVVEYSLPFKALRFWSNLYHVVVLERQHVYLKSAS